MTKLIRRNLFYSSEKALKLTHSNVRINQISGGNTQDPRFRERGGEGRGVEERRLVGEDGEGRERLRGARTVAPARDDGQVESMSS